ncbi:diiron oxygenase [Hoeflea poritis]|uniref:Diiron oxygenase n=1 Tax=Hoeflea poritis TaxID=2993659 RepID=A0ABT4VKN2_9HYPH|nr:diiron oxygenase [Hoeflea poritis]MDA4845231.1 diiron oxygenase [Hoeflea poritis]
MCGVTGFFAGCELAELCQGGRGACSLIDGPDALFDWHRRAAVRNAPRYMLNEDDIGDHLFPQKLAPVLKHPRVRQLDGEHICGLLNNHLFRYLDFTAKLEMAVVNDVVKDIAFGHMPMPLDDLAILAAHKIYVDEAFHALMSVDLLQQAQQLLQVEAILPKAPRFLRELRGHLSAAKSEEERRLIRLFFVIVSETLITNSLTDIRQDRNLPVAVRKTLAQHAKDEAAHQKFFLGLLRGLWPVLRPSDQAFCLLLIPRFVHAFVAPDYQAMASELHAFGLSLDDAQIVIRETYEAKVIDQFAQTCSSDLVLLIEELTSTQTNEAWRLFRQTGGLAA